jgi:transcriptional regulator with XRE-family HTH domain
MRRTVNDFESRKDKLNNKNLKIMRRVYGATQDEVAELIGVSRVSISNWENGVGGMISKVNLRRLSELYGLGIDYFFNRELDEEAKLTILRKKNHDLLPPEERQKFIPVQAPPAPAVAVVEPTTRPDDQFQTLFKKYTFQDAVDNYMCAMKLVIALSVDCSLEELELANRIITQMGRRLQSALDSRKDELDSDDDVQILYSQLEDASETRLF